MTLPIMLGALIGSIVLGLIGFVLGRRLDDGFYQSNHHHNAIALTSVYVPAGAVLGIIATVIITKI